MSRALGLRQRSILLVGFPVCCQLVFSGISIFFLSKVQESVVKEAISRELVSETDMLETQSSEMAQSIHIEHSKGVTDIEHIGRLIAKSQGRLQHIVDLAQGDPRREARVRKLKDAFNELVPIFEKIAEDNRSHGHWMDFTGDGHTALNRASMDVVNCVSEVTQAEETERNSNPERSDRARAQLRLALILSAIASMAMALIAAYMYTVGIQRPLARLKENGRRLSQGVALLPLVTVSDELGELDTVLHSVADSVNKALASDQAMIDNAADLICSLDEHGVFTRVNPFVRQMLGFSQEEMIGKSLIQMVAAQDSIKADQSLNDSVGKEGTKLFELKLNRHDGSTLDTNWSCFWSEREKNLFCVVRDVTEQRRVERMKKEFAELISRDLTTPLVGLLGSTQSLATNSRKSLPEDAQKEVLRAKGNVERLILMLGGLLDFATLESGTMKLEIIQCQLSEIVADAFEMVGTLAETSGVKLENAVLSQTNLKCDRNKILQVLVNFLTNAIKFSPRDTTVTVYASPSPSAIEIGVTDQGPGIPPEFRERIFAAFEQAPSEKSSLGIGLGLAICKMIVRCHHGKIGVRVEHTENKPVVVAGDERKTGSTFWINLPQ